ncbi:MAG: VWA domain-containing protein [Nannocystaceae bacterium]|nr:VWA domain-containing protein [Myxococcales bacterium]
MSKDATVILNIALITAIGALAACGGSQGDSVTEGDPTGVTSATTGSTGKTSDDGTATDATSDGTGSSSGEADSDVDTDETTSDATASSDSDTTATTTEDPSESTTDETTDGVTTDWEPMPCQVEVTKTEPKPSNVLFVLDKSGSMSMELWDHDDDVDTEPISRWTSLHSVVSFIVNEFDDTINFGAKLFPKFDAGSYIDQGACDVDPGVEVPIASMNADAVLAGIPDEEYAVLGGTPVYTGLSEAFAYMVEDTNPDSTRAVVLVADGEISCNESDFEAVMAINIAHEDHDISTYVVGIDAKGVATEQLNLYAEAGGKPNPMGINGAQFYQTFDQVQLHEAIQSIVFDTIGCVVPVDPIPDYPELFEVWIDDVLVGEVGSCGQDGWMWTKPDHSELALCGSFCDEFKLTGEFTAKYWCIPE